MQSRYYTAPRSILSAKAPLSQVEASFRGLPTTPPVPVAPRYSDEERLALSAWSSARLRTAPLIEQVETLMHYPGLEPVYPRQARRALESKCPVALADVAATLWRVMLEKHDSRLRMRRRNPQLFNLLKA